jgi:hypothetical protein
VNKQHQQAATQFSTRPCGTIEHAVIVLKLLARPSIPSLSRWRQRFVHQEPGALLSRAPWPTPTRVR